MKKVLPLKKAEEDGKPLRTLLPILAVVVVAAFALLLIVGFENVLALFRYRVTLVLVIGPIFALFLWCAYKAFGPQDKS